MIYHGSDASPGARTNGSPLPKRRIRRAGVGARATVTHGHPYNQRGGDGPSVRRLRSEPMRKDGSSQYGSGAMSPTRLSPTAADWVPVPQRSSTATPTPCPAAGRAKSPPFLSYAAVAKLSQSRPQLAPLPPPPCPISARPSQGNASDNVQAARRPAAKTDNTNDVGALVTAYKAPLSERRDAFFQSESTDGGALLIDNDTEMVDMPSADPPSVLDKIYQFNSEVLSECEFAMDCSQTTPTKEYKAPGVKKSTPIQYGFYSPVRGQAAQLALDESPFFPKTLLEYNKVIAETNAEARARDRVRERVHVWSWLERTAELPSNAPRTASRNSRETGKRIQFSPWLLGGRNYGVCEPGNAYCGYSPTLNRQTSVEIEYEDLNRKMRDLFDYIDSPES